MTNVQFTDTVPRAEFPCAMETYCNGGAAKQTYDLLQRCVSAVKAYNGMSIPMRAAVTVPALLAIVSCGQSVKTLIQAAQEPTWAGVAKKTAIATAWSVSAVANGILSYTLFNRS